MRALATAVLSTWFFAGCSGDESSQTDNTTNGSETPAVPVFTKGPSVTLAASGVFPGIVHDGTGIVVSYAQANDLYLRRFDDDLQPQADAVKVTSSGSVTDHKHVFFDGAHYLLYSTVGDVDLYLIRLDTSFAQSGSTVTVAEDSNNTRTNDMLLSVNDDLIATGQFRPGNLNGNQNSGHLIRQYDPDALTQVGSDIVANFVAHTNTASTMNLNSYNLIVAPSGPVSGGQVATQRNLLLLNFDTAWDASEADASAAILVDGSTIEHDTNGDGIWMSTGLAYDTTSGLLLVGHTFVDGAGGSDAGQIYLRAFSRSTLDEVYSEVLVDSSEANRAHFLLRDDTLYVVYDTDTTILGVTVAIER